MAKSKKSNNKVIKHLKGDIKMFKHEAGEDRELIKSLSKKAKKKDPKKKDHEKKESAKEEKIERVMREYKEGKLHSGSKKGPKVQKRNQAVAIALSEAKKMKKRKKSGKKQK